MSPRWYIPRTSTVSAIPISIGNVNIEIIREWLGRKYFVRRNADCSEHIEIFRAGAMDHRLLIVCPGRYLVKTESGGLTTLHEWQFDTIFKEKSVA